MSSYISSQANRFYTALESDFGSVATITASNRIPALKLSVQQKLTAGERKDKTGSRTFCGAPAGGRCRTDFELHTYMTSWDKSSNGPAYGPLFQAALGATPLRFSGGTIATGTTASKLKFTTAHGLSAGQAVSNGGEVRFVSAIVDTATVMLNVPFSEVPAEGAVLGQAVTYTPATELPSVTVFDYWSPTTAVQRLLRGAGVDELEIVINGDYHEFHFSGLAKDVADSSSVSAGAEDINTFPAEPTVGTFDYSIVPGSMGQAWLGSEPAEFLTITSASVSLKNNLDTRSREFGSNLPRALSPARRAVTAKFELFSIDDDQTQGLYEAARQESPISVMFQLGEADGQVMAVHMKSVIPVVPEFDDSLNRLQWSFRSSRAQGTTDDEIAVAFG